MADHTVQISLIRCKGCGRHGLSLDDPTGDTGVRLTGHKCGGGWTAVEEFRCMFSDDDLAQAEIGTEATNGN